MGEDFFSKLDQKLDKLASEKEEAKLKKMEIEETVKNIIISITPLLNNYKSQLEARKISVQCSIYDTGFSFVLNYSDGGYFGIALEKDYKYDRYRFVSKYTNDDGKHYIGEGSGPVISENFSIDEFEKYLQNTINDFLFFSKRHRSL